MTPIDAPLSAARRAEIVDEFGRLDAKLAGVAGDVAKHKKLREQIAGWYEQADPEQEYVEHGERFTASISKRAEERKILSMRAVYRRLGLKRFLELVSMTLKNLDAAIALDDQKGLTARARTGSRRVTSAEIAAEIAS